MGLLTLTLAGSLAATAPNAPAPASPAWLTVADAQGSYTLPYIQSDRELQVQLVFADAAPNVANLVLRGPTGKPVGRPVKVTDAMPTAVFPKLAAGEYTLNIEMLDAAGKVVSRQAFSRIGVGTVVAAVGDSLTEGYLGHGFKRDSLDLKAADFPPDAVSKDGRNFPQFAPTTAVHQPAVNCFQSWMSPLNDALTAAWRQPVFIANEGFGGYTAARTLAMMRENSNGWQTRMTQLRPSVWLIHLGVNDERGKVPAAEFAENLRAIVDILIADYAARPENIYLARPSYDYAEGAEPILKGYIAEIDRIVKERKLRNGPDFFATFAKDKAKWYGNDPVHPGPEGLELMAELWTKQLKGNAPVPPSIEPPSFVRELRGGKPQIIVAYGTSLTAGGAWVAGLQQALDKKFPGKAKVINSGKGAMCSVWGVENLDAQVLANQPDALIMEFSVNDAYLPYKLTVKDCEKNLTTILDRVQVARPHCQVILMVMNPPIREHAKNRPELAKFDAVYRRVAAERGLLLIDHGPPWQKILRRGEPAYLKLVSDGVHPDAAGSLEITLPTILKALGLK
jgi:lysophospholipase L1-like esterase